MLSKPNVFTRNDPITRRDVQPVLGNGSRLATGSVAANPIATNSSGEAANAAAAQDAPPTLVAAIDSPAAEALEARLIVGPDVKLKGAEILDCDTLVVEGRVEATMDSRVIRIAEKGYFSGKVSIDIAEIHGTFEGELTARSQLIIHSTGRVSGTIRFGKLVVDEGGELCGDINIIAAKTPSKPSQILEPFVKASAAGN
ncbi:MAG TPA: polymer-forming cytoskeletal protein [Rhodocyclaceae bacterium]|nr:polymer-forming cytoskeletal protein [Rhodocyclaceae bacterium]